MVQDHIYTLQVGAADTAVTDPRASHNPTHVQVHIDELCPKATAEWPSAAAPGTSPPPSALSQNR